MRTFSKLNWLVSCLGALCCLTAGVQTSQAAPGLDQRPTVGAYLDGAFPAATPGSGGSYSSVIAFPNLTFNSPIRMFPEPGSTRLWVIGREGHVYHFDGSTPNTSTKVTALDISAVTQGRGDCGLLGFAFHPEYGQAGSPNANYIYLYYNYSLSPTQSGTPSNVRSYNRLSRFEVDPATLLITQTSEFVLINQYDQHAWHNGGDMFFGPDGFLYLANGDEGSANDPWNNGQVINRGLFAGVFRIDVDQQGGDISHPIRRQPIANGTPPSGWPGTYSQGYYIPNDNPFVDPSGSQLEEFYALGLRSPHRMTRDPVSGKVFIGDIGQGKQEEVSVLDGPALNYQWPFREGGIAGPKSQPNPLIGTSQPPLHSYGRGVGGCVIGGFVYRGSEHAGDLGGLYIFGDHNNGQVWTLEWEGLTTPVRTPLLTVPPGNKWNGLSGFGLDHDDELYIMTLGLQGRIRKLVRNGGGPQPPALLSQTGAFADLASLTPSQGLIPYTINSPLWSDGADKNRWIAVPNDGAPYDANERIVFSATGEYVYPVGTVIVKHFELAVDETNPNSRTRLETRFMVRTADEWYGVTYRWREDGTEADLLLDSETRDVTIDTEGGGTRIQQWYFPSRTDCNQCHNRNSGEVLGLHTWQLNGDFTYALTGRTDNQLSTWSAIGLFDQTLSSAQIDGFLHSVPVDDPQASLETRMRSYVDANCAHCHRPEGVRAQMDARFSTALADQSIVNGFIENKLGIVGAKEVKPESHSQSIMHVRMGGLDEAIAMPPIARNVVDQKAMETLSDWIATLRDPAVPTDPGVAAPVATDDIGAVQPGGTVSLPLLVNDSDADAPLYYGAITFTQLPAHGVVAIDAGNEQVTYTHDDSASLVDTFRYTVSDPSGQISNEATVSLTITQPNLPPVVTNPGDQESIRGETVSLPILATDSEEDDLAYSATGLPAGLTIDSQSGLISGTVDPIADATNNVTITVTDGELPISVEFVWTTSTSAPPFTGSDIGDFGPAGSFSLDSGNGIYTVSGSGRDIFFDEDGFHFVHLPLEGDGEVFVRVRSFQNTNPWAKAGVMIREDLAGGSRHATAFVTPPGAGNGFGMVWRPTADGSTSYAGGPGLSPNPDNWVRLVREGDVITSYASADGVVWNLMGTASLNGLPTTVFVGLAVTSSESDVAATATFDNLTLTGNQPVVRPDVVLAASSTIEAGPFTIDATFSQPVTGLESVDFVVSNGTASDLTGSGDSYEIVITPTAAGIVDVRLPENVAINTAGNGNTESNPILVNYAPPGVVSLPGQDVGETDASGSTSYDPPTETYTVTGSGRDIFFDEDGFQFAVTQLDGDGEIRARITGQTADNPWAKSGVMFRESLSGSARHATVFTTPNAANNGYGMVWRSTAGSASGYAAGPPLNPEPDNWVRLVRQGETLTGYTSTDGVAWTLVSSISLVGLSDNLFVGLAVTSASNGDLATSTFDNVSIVGSQVAVAPVATLSTSSSTETGPFIVQATFTQPVVGLEESDFTVTNGGTSGLIGQGASYSVTVTPTAEGLVSIELPADSASNASGTGTLASNLIEVDYVPPLTTELTGTDIGELFTLGSTSFNSASGVYTLRASGRDIFFEADGLQLAQIQISGDGDLRARISSQSNTNPWAKAGVMIREDLSAGSRHAMAFTTPEPASNGYGMVWRPAADGPTSYAGGPDVNTPPDNWVRISRTGDTLITYSSSDGSIWTELGRATLTNLPTDLYFGLAVTASSNVQFANVTFDNVQISGTPTAAAPPPPPSSAGEEDDSEGGTSPSSEPGPGQASSSTQVNALGSATFTAQSTTFLAPRLRMNQLNTGEVTASYRRSPGSAVSIALHGTLDLSTSPNGWVALNLNPTINDNGDGTETVTFGDLANQGIFQGQESGFVRLYVEADADHDGFAETITQGCVLGWYRRSLEAGTATFSMPFSNPALYTGLIRSVDGSSLSVFGTGVPNETPHYMEILTGESAGHRFEIDETATSSTTLALDLESVDAERNTLPTLPNDLAGAAIAVRPHHRIKDLFSDDAFQSGTNANDADRILFFRDGRYETLWLLQAGNLTPRWIADGDATLTDAGSRVIPTGEGVLLRRISGGPSLVALGEVSSAPIALPLRAGASLFGNPWPFGGTPSSWDMRVATGFVGAPTVESADQIQLWRGDTVPGSSGFDIYYLLQAGNFQQWVRGGDATLANQNETEMADPTRAVFLQLRTDRPQFKVPVPWQP